MGDAGPRILNPPIENPAIEAGTPEGGVREIHVLVTGFGAFKSFSNNPSYLVAASLPEHLDPLPRESMRVSPTPTSIPQPPQHPLAALLGRPVAVSQPKPSDPPLSPQPIRSSNPQPYRIRIHSFPNPLYVAYAPTSTLIPSLLDPRTNRPPHVDFDYVLHIGLASGRDSYTLETNAHRDEYDIKDVDDEEGYLPGEKIWKSLDPPIPERLDVGWLPSDVLAKWEAEVERRQDVMERGLDRMLEEMARGSPSARDELLTNSGLRQRLIGHHNTREQQYVRRPRRAVVKLSRDAGRYLCEFILMCSLVYRYRDARGDFEESEDVENSEQEGYNYHHHHYHDTANSNDNNTPTTSLQPPLHRRAHATEKVGKVAFLHVPNGTEPDDIERGKMVAESAIQALVASWEAGYRNPLVYSWQDPIDRAKLYIIGEDDKLPPVNQQPTAVRLPMRTRNEGSAVDSNDGGFETRGTGDS